MPKLHILLPDSTSIIHELTDEMITLGRAPDNMIQIDNGSVSGHHAQIQLIGDNYHLKDLNSTNGTMRNGEPVTTIQLRLGDRLRFGKVDAHFESDVTGEAHPLPRADAIEAHPADVSEKPTDFANASPFAKRSKEKDVAGKAILAGTVIAILALIGSMMAVMHLQPPAL